MSEREQSQTAKGPQPAGSVSNFSGAAADFLSFISPRFDVQTFFNRLLRLGPGAVFQHEWRDDAQPSYQVGPSLGFEKGKLRTPHGELMEVPAEAWVTIEISAALGQDAGTWDLTVGLPDAPARTFKNLKIVTPEWKTLDWLGFVSQSDKETEAGMDDLRLEMDL